MKVLVADDDVVFRHLLQTTLTQWDYQVVAVSDGTAAWAGGGAGRGASRPPHPGVGHRPGHRSGSTYGPGFDS